MSTGIHVLLIDSHEGDRQYYAQRLKSSSPDLTKLDHTAFLALALKNGACKAMQKGGTSGDVLDQTIAKAIATVPREKYRNPVSQEQSYRCS